MNIIDNDLLSMQEARILVENASEAQQKLSTFGQDRLDEIVNTMIDSIEGHLEELAVMASEETNYGNADDKYLKNKFICNYVKKKLTDMNCVGIIAEDKENKTMDIGVPVGVIAAFCPSTSPVSTTIYNALIAIKSGNAIIFSPHKKARKAISKTLDILIKAAESCGLPEGALSYLHTVTKMGSVELMNHKQTSLIMNTGVQALLQEAYKAGKPVIYGGTGNGPAFIERTADIKKAVKDIISSKSFDNGIVSGSEQCVVVDSSIATEVKKEMLENGAYFMTEEESQKLGEILFCKLGLLEPLYIGRTPQFLAKMAGFSVGSDVKLLVSQQKYVSENNPYSKEILSPVIAFYIENDWMHACEKCIELLLTQRQGHTLVIHSNDEEVIKQFALKKPVGRILVNTPGAFGSMGATTNLFPSMTLGSGSAGKGMTSDNVSPMNLIYIRKVGYGVRNISDIECNCKDKKSFNADNNVNLDINLLTELLEKILNK